MDKKPNQSDPPTPEKPSKSPISSTPTIEEEPDALDIGPYLTKEEYLQLLRDEATFKEHLEEQAKIDKENEIKQKKLDDYWKKWEEHDALFRMEFGEKSDSEYETN